MAAIPFIFIPVPSEISTLMALGTPTLVLFSSPKVAGQATATPNLFFGFEGQNWTSIEPNNSPTYIKFPTTFAAKPTLTAQDFINFKYNTANNNNKELTWSILNPLNILAGLPATIITTGVITSTGDWPATAPATATATAPVVTSLPRPSNSKDDSRTQIDSPLSTTSTVGPSATNGTSYGTPNSVSKSQGLPSGAAAGLAIGCLIAGALITGALLWFFCIRSRGRRTRDMEASSIALIRNEKGPVAKTTSLESGSPPARSLDNGLPQPLEDGAIAGEISKISSLIKNHVQSFYHHDRVGLGMLDLDDLQALGSLPISPGTLSTLLGNVDTREIALRFSIAWTIISRIQPSDNASTTFLPPEIATCFQSIPVATHKTRAQANYLGKWRSVTAELMQSSYGRSTFPVTDPRTRNIEKAANILDGILRPYVDSRVNNNERRRNLEEILKRAAIFAFTLFSQPSSWDFDWRGEEGVQSNSLCIFPALVQVTDELGDPVKPPRALSEAIVRKLDG